MGSGFLKSAHWLDARRVRAYLWLSALVQIGALGWLVATARDGVDRNGFLLGSDFLSFWTAGRMLVAGATPYDVAAHAAAQHAWFPQDGAHVAFFYPPPFLLACHPLGLVGYFPALGLWLALTGAAWVATVRLWARDVGAGPPAPPRALPPVWLLCAAFPPALVTITHGQTSFLASALIGAGALLVSRRPWLAGALFGLAVFKPQLGLLIPVVLLATRQWRAVLAACASAAALALAATALYGPGVWTQWHAITGQAGEAMANDSIGYAKMVSVAAAAMLLGLPAQAAMALQVAVALGVAATLALAGWRNGQSPALAAAMLAGTPLATPFVLDYDLALLAFPLLWLAVQEHRPWERIVTALVFVAPAFARPLAMHAGLPVMAPLILAFFVLVARRTIVRDRGDRLRRV